MAAEGETARLVSSAPAAGVEEDPLEGHSVILFDGVCLLCSKFIHFVLDHDPAERFKFATLQSDFAVELVKKHGIKPDLSTVVVVDEAGAHVRSTAALRVLLHCGWPYSLLYYTFIWVPAPLRDLGYKAVAASRYQVFGKDETVCRRFTKDMRRRFLSPPSAA